MKILAALLIIFGFSKCFMFSSSSTNVNFTEENNLIDSDKLIKITKCIIIFESLVEILCGLFIFFGM